MNLTEIMEAYKVKKLAYEQAKKEEEKYKSLLKAEMLKAGVKDHTDDSGYRYERIEQTRQKIDEPKLLEELRSRGLEACIKTVEAVDEEATLKAVESGELPAEVLSDCVQTTEVVVLKLTAPKKPKA